MNLTLDNRMTLAAATAAGTNVAQRSQDIARLPSEAQTRAALDLGYNVGRTLAKMTQEEVSSFRLGLLAAWEAPYNA